MNEANERARFWYRRSMWEAVGEIIAGLFLAAAVTICAAAIWVVFGGDFG